ncbi:MAG TPA: anti-sigma factor [Burkholderiaceae bacterium]|nr:anti-sigma factor [Burkholderiaceae bacterium]
MNLMQHPDLLERIAAGHALGTLRGGARRRFEAMAREQAPVRAAALVWQARLSGMAELQPEIAPDPAVWARIHNLVQAELAQKSMQAARATAQAKPSGAGWWRNLPLWRSAALAGALASVVVLVTGMNLREQMGTRFSEQLATQARGMGAQIAELRTQLQAAPQIQYVAVLADDKSAAAILVTVDPRHQRLTLQRVGGYQEAGDKSLQLWALPPQGAPRSLGVLGADKVLRLTASENEVREVPALAISLEPRGGVPSEGGPTGPVLFKGALLQTVL